MSPLSAPDWDIIWKPHWPLPQCPMPGVQGVIHEMRHTMSTEGSGGYFECDLCGLYFLDEESMSFFAAAHRLGQLINDKHHKN